LIRVQFMITGAAPIAADVLTDLRAMLGAVMLEGYGQTEATAGTNVTLPGDNAAGHVGPPVPCNEIKLCDVEDMGLKAERDNRGEVCFRGPNVFAGYLHDKKKTAEAIDADNWLHSGDVGIWLPNGALKIVDRKKAIFKLAQGGTSCGVVGGVAGVGLTLSACRGVCRVREPGEGGERVYSGPALCAGLCLWQFSAVLAGQCVPSRPERHDHGLKWTLFLCPLSCPCVSDSCGCSGGDLCG
jgi:hypothetical protein